MVTEPLVSNETLEVPRRKLRGALRKAREDAGISQQQVAARLERSRSWLARLEQGERSAEPAEVRRLLDLYGVRDHTRVRELMELAELTSGRPWRIYADAFGSAALTLYRNEPAASTILKYEPRFIPGLIQTENYTRSLLSALGFDSEAVEARLRVIRARRRMLDSSSRPDMSIVLGEAVLSRPVGSIDVMNEQVKELRRFARTDGVSVQVLPFSAGPHEGIGQAFTILQFSDADLDDILFVEDSRQRPRALDDEKVIERHRAIFKDLQRLAVEPGGSDREMNRIATSALAV